MSPPSQFYLAHHGTGRNPVTRLGMVVIATVAELTGHDPGAGFTLTGQPLTRTELIKIACDCAIHRKLVDADGATLDFGRATRSVPPELRLAVAARDRHCRFPGCFRPPDECDVHHIKHWAADDGPTDLNNLALGCFTHHGVFHRDGWTVTGTGEELHITPPSGRTTLISRPPPHDPTQQRPSLDRERSAAA